MLHRPSRQGGSISKSQFTVCTRGTIMVTEHFKDRHATAEVLCCPSRIRLQHREHARKPLSFAREAKISSRVGRLFVYLL